MTSKTVIAFIILIGCAAPVFGGEHLTLETAIELALENNHEIRMARNNEAIGKNRVNIGNAGLLPKLDLVSTANYRDSRTGASAGSVTQESTQNNTRVQATYTLFDGLGNIFSFNRLKAAGRLGELQARSSIENTVLQVSRVYYEVADATEILAIAQEALAISTDRLARAKNQSQYGQARAIDVLSAEVDLNSDSTSYLNARLTLAEARRDLNLLLNRSLSEEFTVDTAVTYLRNPDREHLRESALRGNAAYLIAQNYLEQARLDSRLAWSEFFPRLDLQLAYGYNETTSGWGIKYDDPNREFSASLTLTFNLFNGFKNNIERQNAKLAMNNRRLFRDEARLNLERSLTNAFEAYLNSLEILSLQERNLRSADLNFLRTRDLYNLGQVTTTTFREAQLNLVRAKNNISSAKYNAKIRELQLLQLTGQLVEKIT